MSKEDSPNVNKLKSFMRRYNMVTAREAPRRVNDAHWQAFGNDVLSAAYSQYFDNANGYRGIRPSNAYKPAIVHVLNKFGVGIETPTIKWNRAYAPFIGHVTEALMYVLLTEHGVAYKRGTSLNVLNNTMCGTPDFTLDNAVVDIKSANGSYYRQFSNAPDDNRGYITQLHLYAEALGTREMYVLMLCKEWASAQLTQIAYSKDCLDSVKRRIECINAAQSVDYIVNCPIPSLMQNRKGGLIVMPQMRYDPCKHLLYVMATDDEWGNEAIRVRTYDEILAIINEPATVDDDVAFDDTDDTYLTN